MLPVAGCTRCPELAANRRCIVPGYGDPQARLMIVGEAPGYRGADRTGVPFTSDRSGRRLQALLIALGLSAATDPALPAPQLQGVFVTNVVRCNPPANRNPTAAEVANCAPYLREELQRVRPQVVATCGLFAARWACAELLREPLPSGLRAMHGQSRQASDLKIVFLVHPARASREQMAIARMALEGALAPTASTTSGGTHGWRPLDWRPIGDGDDEGGDAGRA